VTTPLHKPKQHHQGKWNGRFKGCVVIFGNRCDPFPIPDSGFWIRKSDLRMLAATFTKSVPPGRFSNRLKALSGTDAGVSRAAFQAFQTCPGFVFTTAMALRVSTMHGDQSASSW
jgi:hypothetical protein